MDNVGISSAIVEPVARALAELGYVPPPLPANHGIVAGDSADAVLDDSSVTLGDPAIGLTIAQRIPIGALGDLDYALCTSRTLREGLARLARFYGLTTQRVKLVLVEENDAARLVFTRMPPLTHSPHWLEFASAMIAGRIRLTLGLQNAFADASFVHPAPANRVAHDAFFRTVHFSSAQDRLTFPRELLDRPLRTMSAALASALDVKLKQLEPTMTTRAPFLAAMRTAIVELLDLRETGLVATAARLRSTPRTLQRQLKELGTSHREMLDEIRRERALKLLEQGKIISEVSVALGFSEPSAFFRAFRRWTGTSPRGSVKPRVRKTKGSEAGQ